MAGDRSWLGFAWYQWDYRNHDVCVNGVNPPPGSCDEIVQKGGVHRIMGRRRPAIPTPGAAWRLAVAGNRIAFVPLANGAKRTIHPPAVQIRTADTGALIATASWTSGRPRAIAMTRQRLAVLINDSSALRIDIFQTNTGQLLASYKVSDTAANRLDMSRAGVLFETNMSRPHLRLVDPDTGERRTVANLRKVPVDFSLEGRHARWAINLGSDGYIRQATIN
jgi:hypothetical protein